MSLTPGSGGPRGKGNGYALQYSWSFPGGSDGKESACNAGDPTVKPFCLLLPSPGREFRSQGEKKNPLLLCWRNVERGRRAEAQGWVSPGKSLCCAPAATRSSKHTREWLQLSSERGGTSARKSVGFCNNWQGSPTGCYCSCTTLLLVPV